MRWFELLRAASGLALLGACAACGPGPAEREEDASPPAATAVQATDAAAAASNAPIENLRVPLEHYPDGKVKTQVVAAAAQMPEEGGDVQAKRIRIETYLPGGEIENLVMAEECRYNREKNTASSDAGVHFEREGVLITGRGFVWNGNEQTVRIMRDVKVVLRQGIRWDSAFAGARQKKGSGTE